MLTSAACASRSPLVAGPEHPRLRLSQGILTWLVIVEKEDGTYRVHYRSKGPHIHKLAEAHDGGGHELASGATAHDQAEIDQIFQELVEVTKEYKEDHE